MCIYIYIKLISGIYVHIPYTHGFYLESEIVMTLTKFQAGFMLPGTGIPVSQGWWTPYPRRGHWDSTAGAGAGRLGRASWSQRS